MFGALVARLCDIVGAFVALASQALNNTNVTGTYLMLRNYRGARFTLNVGAMAATKTTTLALYAAADRDGTDAAAITGASAVVTANTKVVKATADLTSAAATDVVTVNGVSFTMAAATSAADREFADAAGLVTCVNDADYGASGVHASASGAVVTFEAEYPGELPDGITLAKTEVAGTTTLATVSAMVIVDLSGATLTDALPWVAPKVTTTANSVVGVVADLYGPRTGGLGSVSAIARA